MTTGKAYFKADGSGRFRPGENARSAWSPEMLAGLVIVGLLARAVETGRCVEGFQPARLTVDLYAPVRSEPLTVLTNAVRAGTRIHVTDARVLQGEEPVARATLIQLRRAEQPPGEPWRSRRRTVLPDVRPGQLSAGSAPYWGSGEGPSSSDMAAQQGAHRKRSWRHPLDVVEGEQASPFQRAAVIAEATSLMAHWGTEGIGFINADLTVALARLPRSGDIGIEADEHISDSGVAVGTATLFDRDGMFGTGTVVAVSNAGRQIDFSKRGLVKGRGPGGSGSDSGADPEKGMRV